MSLPAIEVSGLSKRYVIQHESRHDNLRDTLHHTARKAWRKLRWGTSFETEEFMALNDVSFTVQPGEVVGIIGRNGAGKSTLLKILSRITEPTAGKVTIRGRVASLLEVGTGFHPDLTGRENVYLNGAILGMSRVEIRKKFDEIVAFAEVEKFLDTPVKRYSSGMYVRLAFAVAAHLEPEILIIDEVLAVGDAKFQKKCLGKIKDVSHNSGRAVLFVSHNMGVVANLCSRAILLQSGEVRKDGPAGQVVTEYIQAGNETAGEVHWSSENTKAGNECARLLSARILSSEGSIVSDVAIDQPMSIEYDFRILTSTVVATSSIHLYDKQGVCVFSNGPDNQTLSPGRYRHRVTIPANLLNDGLYTVDILVLTNSSQIEFHVQDAISFCVNETGAGRADFSGTIIGCIRPRLSWTSESLNA